VLMLLCLITPLRPILYGGDRVRWHPTIAFELNPEGWTSTRGGMGK
jgi:hypothetical protein